MAGSSTNLDLLSASQSNKETTANHLFDAASPATSFGRRASTSAGLTWGYYGGVALVSGEPIIHANGTIALTSSTTNYLYLEMGTSAWVVTKATSPPSGWPGPIEDKIALYEIVTGSATVTSYIDYRTGDMVAALTGGAASGGSAYAAQTASGGSFTTFSFTSIPSTGYNIELWVTGKSRTAGNGGEVVYAKFNSDGTAENYSNSQYLSGSSSTASAGQSNSTTSGGVIGVIPESGGTVGSFIARIIGYKGATFHKIVVSEGGYNTGAPADVVRPQFMRWNGTGAITQIDIIGVFADNSTCVMYIK